jgi:hypothetical protein
MSNEPGIFCANPGWRLDVDVSAGDDFRIIQFTPTGSGCSIILGKGVTAATPGSVHGLLLTVSDIVAARDNLMLRGIEVGEPFHDAGGVFHHAGAERRLGGLNPQRKSYASFAAFNDPAGNGWLLQEVTVRLPGDVEAANPSFTPKVAKAVRLAMAR